MPCTPPVSLLRTAVSRRAGSPFNPLRCRRASVQALKTNAIAATTSTQTHLANLEHILQKQPAPPLFPIPNHGKDRDPPNTGGGGGLLLETLNLPSLFPSFRKQPEEIMSPRTLTRLLSDSTRPSPRGPIASRWRHYQGTNDWAGLLDPLDKNFFRELVRCGDLIQAAYHAFHSHPDISPDAPHPITLPDRSYRVTRPLFATASVEVPPLVDCFVAP